MKVVRVLSTIHGRRAAAAPIALAIALASLPASADEPGAATAEALFRDARALIAKRDYAAACPKLEESLRLDPAPGTLFNLARCYELEGRLASARRAYGEVADAMAAEHQPERERVARGRVAAIEPRLSYVVVQLDPELAASESRNLRVTFDGRELPASELGQRVPADVGDHVFAVSAEGRRGWEEHVRVQRDAETVEIHVPMLETDRGQAAALPSPAAPVDAEPPIAKTAVPAEAPAPAAPFEKTDKQGLGVQRLAALALLASSVVGAGLGTYFGLEAFGLGNAARNGGCTDRGCTNSTALSEASDSHTAGDASTVSFVACGVLAASGAILWITGQRSVVVAPGLSPRAAVWVQGRF